MSEAWSTGVVEALLAREEVAREALPAGEYRLAVGGSGAGTAFEMVKAAAAAPFWAAAARRVAARAATILVRSRAARASTPRTPAAGPRCTTQSGAGASTWRSSLAKRPP